MEMVLLMGNHDCMADKLLDNCYRTMMQQERTIEALETQVLALQLQAAESEDRADEEKRKRLQLLMRI